MGLRPTTGRPTPDTTSTRLFLSRVPTPRASTSHTTQQRKPCGLWPAGQSRAAARTRAWTSLRLHMRCAGNHSSDSKRPGAISISFARSSSASGHDLASPDFSPGRSRLRPALSTSIRRRCRSARSRTRVRSASSSPERPPGFETRCSSARSRSTANKPSGAFIAARSHCAASRRRRARVRWKTQLSSCATCRPASTRQKSVPRWLRHGATTGRLPASLRQSHPSQRRLARARFMTSSTSASSGSLSAPATTARTAICTFGVRVSVTDRSRLSTRSSATTEPSRRAAPRHCTAVAPPACASPRSVAAPNRPPETLPAAIVPIDAFRPIRIVPASASVPKATAPRVASRPVAHECLHRAHRILRASTATVEGRPFHDTAATLPGLLRHPKRSVDGAARSIDPGFPRDKVNHHFAHLLHRRSHATPLRRTAERRGWP